MLPDPLTNVPTALLALAFWIHPPIPQDVPTVTVLTYHTFDAPKITPYTVESAHLREQMQYLKDQHLPVVPMAQLVAHIRIGAPIPDHSVVITIDDGYKSALTKAFPILNEFGYPFTEFIYPQYIGKGAALTWDDVAELEKDGVDIQSHSLTHPLLTHPGKPMVLKDYVAWVDRELVESKRILEEKLGKPVTILAYPFGGYDERVVERTRLAGYELALTCDDGNVSRFTAPLHINRRLVYHHVKMKEFAQYFPDRTLQVTDLSPRDGERLHKLPGHLEGRIINIKQVQPGSASILIDKVGGHALPIEVDPVTGRFRFPLPEKKGYYFVSLFALDKADPTLHREASWLFIISRNASKN